MIIVKEIKQMILNGGGMYQGIKIPAPQRCGTMSQRVTFAEITAKRIYENNKEFLNSLLE